MELLLVRHALPVRIEAADGPADPPLSDDGLAQAVRLAEYLSVEPLSSVYTSPMRRALETAAPLAATFGVEAVIEDGVAEYDRHSASYIPLEQLKAENHPDWQAMLDGTWGADFGIDPLEFHHLVVQTVEGIIARHPGEAVAVVCHGGVINSYLSHVLGLAPTTGFFYPHYTSIHRIAAAGTGQRSLVSLNETAHLRGTGLPIGLFSL